jgi:hypothetical protein
MKTDELDEVATSSENAEVDNDELESADDVLHEIEHFELYDHDEDPEHPTTEPDEETVKLFEECGKRSKAFRNAGDEIESLKPTVLRLKDKFGVKKGYEGRRLIVDGHNALLWSEYCQITFNVTSHRMNQLMNAVDKDLGTVVRQQGKPDVEKPLYKKGYAKAVEDLAFKGYVPPVSEHREDVTQEHRDNVVEMQAAPEPKPLDPKDPYAFFEQFKEEPQTMASEIATMLINFDLDDTTLLAALKKELKTQRKEIADSKPKANAASGD